MPQITVAFWLIKGLSTALGGFGTMAADVVHVVLGLDYRLLSLGCAAALGIVFWTWHRVEGTLSVHTIVALVARLSATRSDVQQR